MADGRLDSGPDTTIVEFEATADKELEEEKRNQSSFESNAVGSLMVGCLKSLMVLESLRVVIMFKNCVKLLCG